MTATTEVYVGLGSNLGDRAANLWEALRRLADTRGCHVTRLSRLYESAPIGPQDQDWFINAVVAAEVDLTPHALLACAKEIEQQMGRAPSARWGPRLIDIDLLLFGDAEINTDDLVIPHRELWNRRFAMLPLAELLPSGALLDGVEKRLIELGEEQEVRVWSA